MMKKGYVLLAAAVLTTGLLGACGATTESVVEKMFAQETESFSCDVDLETAGSVGLSGVHIELAADGDMRFEVDQSDQAAPASHIMADISLSYMNAKQDYAVEAYSLTEDDTLTAYTKLSDDDTWRVNTSELVQDTLDEKSRKELRRQLRKILEEAELQKKTQKVGNETCYVLVLDTTLDCFEDSLKLLWDAMDEEAITQEEALGVDAELVSEYLAYFRVEGTFYLSKKSGRCMLAELDFSKSDVDALLAKLTGDLGEAAGYFGIDLSSITADIDKMSVMLQFSDWNDTHIRLPEEVKAAEG